ncbi:MAG: rRNA maturation RNase YbeY [Armatimonadia bacterium]
MIEVEIRDLQDEPLPVDLLRRTVQETAAEVASALPDRVSLVFVDDEQIHEINRRYRHIDRPTDVISFEAEEEEEGETAGEIIVSVPTALRQATAAGHDLHTELAWLVSHGLLHVTGMEDETQEQLDEMLIKQRRVLARLGLGANQ